VLAIGPDFVLKEERYEMPAQINNGGLVAGTKRTNSDGSRTSVILGFTPDDVTLDGRISYPDEGGRSPDDRMKALEATAQTYTYVTMTLTPSVSGRASVTWLNMRLDGVQWTYVDDMAVNYHITMHQEAPSGVSAGAGGATTSTVATTTGSVGLSLATLQVHGQLVGPKTDAAASALIDAVSAP
jgi:hypothetical protein